MRAAAVQLNSTADRDRNIEAAETLVRAAAGDGATLLSWYFVEWDAEVSRLVRRDLHTRPKGPRGTDQRGWYLHKRFFLDAGLYATLNGP